MRFATFFSLILIQLVLPGTISGQNNRPRVIATTTFVADMASAIAGDYAEVISLMPLGGDPHKYDPIPSDVQLIAKSDLVLKNGLTLEGWLDEMISNSGTQAEVVVVTNGVDPIQSSDHENAFDPHAWMDPLNGLIYIKNIRDALIRLMPDQSQVIQENYLQYKWQLENLDLFIEAQINQIPESSRIIITTHDAFSYFAKRYGMRVATFMGTSTDSEIQMEDYNRLVKIIQEDEVPAVFIESATSNKQIMGLKDDMGIVIGGKLFADSLGDEESGADTYLTMLRHNAMTIVAGLRNPAKWAEDAQNFVFIWLLVGIFVLSFLYMWRQMKLKSISNLNWKSYHMSIEGISVSYDRKLALSNVYLDIEPGYVYGLIGGNGSGKSTLMKAILGLIEVDAGTIMLNGHKPERLLPKISYVPQKEEIDWQFPASVLDIVMMGRYPHRKVFESFNESDRQMALNALEQLGIGHLKNRQIGELSGGQQQRAFIARALCQDSEVFLFDEPFVGVDVTTEAKIMEIVRGLAQAGKMVVIIHHDLAKVNEYFDRLIMINQRIVAFGETKKVFTDENIKKTYGGRLTILQKTENYI